MNISDIYDNLNNKNFKSVVESIKILNDSYRNGNSLIPDKEYDKLLNDFQNIDPDNDIFKSGVIESVNSNRKEKLKYPMFSLNKEISVSDIFKWAKNKNLPEDIFLTITSKYDGISILKNEKNGLVWSRGDGFIGETMHEHYKKTNEKNINDEYFTIGEMIIPKETFSNNIFYRDNGEIFKNARNMVAGLKNSDDISNDFKYVKHIRYGIANDNFNMNKSEQLDIISDKLNFIPYIKIQLKDLNIDILNDLFFKWGKEYDIDGLVIDIDDKDIRKSLGRERNNNPAYSIAFKNPDWSEQIETEILDIKWDISKQGYLKPVAILKPINIEGVTISRVTLNNAKFVKENNLGIGSKVVIIRSGMVIPKVIEVIEATGFIMPNIENIYWNKNKVELCVDGTEEQEIKKIISFFKILNVENVSEGIVNQLFKSGYKTLKEILNLKPDDFEKLDKFGKRKSKIVFESIQKSIKNVDLSKLQHASGIFNGLGTLKLVKLEHFKTKPSIEDVILIEGFSEISAKTYIDNYDKFFDFINDLPVTIKTTPKTLTSNDLDGKVFVFTGIRRPDIVKNIESRGGKEGKTISKNTTYLICVDKNSTSSKMNKAISLGVDILDINDLEKLLF